MVREHKVASYKEFAEFVRVGTIEGVGFLDFCGGGTELPDAFVEVDEGLS